MVSAAAIVQFVMISSGELQPVALLEMVLVLPPGTSEPSAMESKPQHEESMGLSSISTFPEIVVSAPKPEIAVSLLPHYSLSIFD